MPQEYIALADAVAIIKARKVEAVRGPDAVYNMLYRAHMHLEKQVEGILKGGQ